MRSLRILIQNNHIINFQIINGFKQIFTAIKDCLAASRRRQFEPERQVVIVTPLGSPGSFLRCKSGICNDTERVAERSESKIPMIAGGNHTAANREVTIRYAPSTHCQRPLAAKK